MARILHDDWSIRLGENRPSQSAQTFGGYGDYATLLKRKLLGDDLSKDNSYLFLANLGSKNPTKGRESLSNLAS